MTNAQGFQSDGEFLDMAAKWMRARSARLSAEKELADATERFENGEDDGPRSQPARHVRCRASVLKEAEEKLHKELEARLEVHRGNDRYPLGIDSVCEASRLSEDERLVITAVTLSCLGNVVAESTFGLMFSSFSGMQVSDAIQLLGATEPSEWLSNRRMFLPDSPLVKNRHLLYDRVPQGPEGLMDVTLSVGRETFALITGTELEPESYDDEAE